MQCVCLTLYWDEHQAMFGCFAPVWPGARGRAHIFAKNIHPSKILQRIYTLARGQGANRRLTRPSTLYPLLVPPLACPPFNCPKCTLFTPPLSQCPCSPEHWAALKLKAQLCQLQKSACALLLKTFFSASLLCDTCTRWLHTLALWQCEWPIVLSRLQ